MWVLVPYSNGLDYNTGQKSSHNPAYEEQEALKKHYMLCYFVTIKFQELNGEMILSYVNNKGIKSCLN